MTIKEQIYNLIKNIVKFDNFIVETPQEKSFGDYATNVAMVLKNKKSPLEIAEKIKLKIKSDLFKKIEIVKPGFINFFLKDSFLQNQIKEVIKQKEKFGQNNIGKGKKIQVEFISANPTGPLTVANARGGPIGDTLANVLSASGFKVEKEFYVNDSGNQIVILGHSILKDKEAQYKGKYINDLQKKFKDKDPLKLGQKAAKYIIKAYIKKTTDKLGIKYDKWFFESSLDNNVINILKRKKLIYEKENAVWFKSSKFGDNRDRVLIKKDKSYTYLARDIAYHLNKFKQRKFDKVINIWGADHHGDVPGLMAGVEAIGFKGKLEIILHQFITILEKGERVRMSKREGKFVTLDELLDKVGPDVVRFFFLMPSANRNMDFDLELAMEKSEKNPVFYIQYAYARINSIFKKAKPKNPKLNLLNHETELELIKQLIKLPEIIEDTANDYQVQRLPHYAMEVARLFHRFYSDCKVLGDYKEMQNARLSLVLATKIVLENILDLMGINKPEKM